MAGVCGDIVVSHGNWEGDSYTFENRIFSLYVLNNLHGKSSYRYS